MEESRALGFGPGAGFKGVRGKGFDAANPMGDEDMGLAGAGSSSFVGVLAGLLSTDWLRERHLGTLCSYLNFRASEDGKGRTVCWVEDAYLPTRLKEAYRETQITICANWDLNNYRDKVIAHTYKCLLFPANLNDNHWVTFGVDLEKKEFRYGAPSYFAASRCTHSLPLYPSRRLAWQP